MHDEYGKSSEGKIDRIDNRLGGIEKLLRTLTPDSSGGGYSPAGENSLVPGPVQSVYGGLTPGSASGDALSTIVDQDEDDASSAFEGHSSMSAQAAWASDFLEEAVQRTSLRDSSPKIDEALASLRHIVGLQNKFANNPESRFPHRKQIPLVGLKGLAMPPVNAVVSVLRTIKGTSSSILGAGSG